MDLEGKYTVLEHDISFMISYDEVFKNSRNLYKSILVQLNSSEEAKGDNILRIPPGKYLTMYFDDSSIDNRKYYTDMINFMKK